MNIERRSCHLSVRIKTCIVSASGICKVNSTCLSAVRAAAGFLLILRVFLFGLRKKERVYKSSVCMFMPVCDFTGNERPDSSRYKYFLTSHRERSCLLRLFIIDIS